MTNIHRRRAVALSVILVLAGIPVLLPGASAEAWTKNDMGQPYAGNAYYGLYGVAVGDGDRDDQNEVYVTSYDDHSVYQYTFTEAGWVSTAIASGGTYVYRVLVGDGDDDGKSEVYAIGYQYVYPRYGPMLEQAYYDSDGWHTEFITTLGYWTYNAALGDGNNDNRTEIYTADYYGHVYQNAKGTTWDSQDIGNTTPASDSTYAHLYGIWVGDGDNDAKNEVYTSSSIGNVDRFSFDGGAWRRTVVGKGEYNTRYGENYSAISAIEVGDGDNDGKNEVYGVSWTNASVYKFSWDSSAKKWNMATIASLGNWIYAYSISIGDADGDGKNEIYAGSYKQVYKVWYDGAAKEWRTVGVGGGNHYMYDLAIGSATGDTGQMELYSACLDGHAYQFYTDKTPPANPKVSSDTHPVPGTWYNQSIVHVTWKDVGYDISGMDGYSVAWDKNAKTVPDNTKDYEEKVQEANSTPLADGGSWYFHIRSRDNAVNWNASATHFGPICIDTAPPDSLSARLNDGAAYAFERRVTVSLSATDPKPGSGVALMSFSNDGKTWSPWETWSGTRYEWDLTESRYGGNDTDGLKTVYVRVRDGAGNEIRPEKRARAEIYMDRVSPYGLSLLINGGDEFATSADVTLALEAFDAASGLSEMAFSNDGVLWGGWTSWENSTSWSLAQGAGGSDSDGDRSVYFRCRDRAGNIAGPVRDTIFLDRSAPGELVVRIDGGADYTTDALGLVGLDISCSEPSPGSGIAAMALGNAPGSLDGWAVFQARVASWSLVNGTGGTDADGNKSVHLRVRDRAGNVAPTASDSIFLDRRAPGPAGLAIDGGAAYTTDLSVDLAITAEDPSPGSGLYAMQFSDDGTRWSDWEPFCTSRAYSLTGPDGPKTVHLRLRDAAGNLASPVCATITLDTQSPVISNVRVLAITDSSAIVAWSTGEEADSLVEYGATSGYGQTVRDGAFVASHAVQLRGLSATTAYHFRVRSADRAQNPPSYSPDLVFITAATPDTSPPMISDVRVQGITDTAAVVGWTTSEPADSAVPYGKTASYGQRASDPAYVLRHSVVLSGLSPSTLYHLRAESKDTTGNGPAASEDLTFTTLSAPDTSPPVISNVRVRGITDRLAVVSWETDEPADAAVEYGNTSAYGSAARDGAFVLLHELTLSGLSPLTTYHFRASSSDVSGNGPARTEDLVFSTVATPDVSPPALSRVRAEGVTASGAVILWETDEPADSFAEFGITQNYGTTAADGSFRLEHSLPLSGLRPDTLYHFRVRSADPSGNAATGAGLTFRTQRNATAPDRTAPAISGVEVTGVSDTRAVVIWRTDELANGEVDYGTTMAYGLRASDPAYVTAHSIVLEGLRPSTEYHLRVKSTDVWGNGPSAGADFRFTTASGPDRTAPAVSEVKVLLVTTSGATISWRTDEPGNSLVEYGPDVSYGRSQTSRLFVLNHTVELSNLAPGTTYHFRVSSTDPAGNPSGAGADLTFTTLRTGGGGGGGNGGDKPKPLPSMPAVSLDSAWPWLLLVAGAAVAAGAGYFIASRRFKRQELSEGESAEAPAPQAEAPKIPKAASPASATPSSPTDTQPASPTGPVPAPTTPRTAPSPEKAEENPARGTDAVETLDMEPSHSPAAAALAKARPPIREPSAVNREPAKDPRITDHGSRPPDATTAPIKHIRCPSCKTRIPLYKEGAQMIQCPGCGKKGPYKPKA
jgi:hypothetical protein